ncbi:MAG: phosphoribosyl-ATP diphosphatase [Gammaproteobacteria bacterium]|jgi:phosphoribosyl-ATP pyrophosphohydrolase|nr:phosphoribosyl-ATP diphosphatase [Chromatiales bacterium]MDP6675905.1 phosphoribosyl-ATP diphosphatase [Gammaproteobacteria bacterium]
MSNTQDIEFLLTLETVIASRRGARIEDSYTAKLLAAGTARIAQKVGEEGVELALASVQGQRDEILLEASDLIYHLLVMLHNHELSLADVVRELKARHN